MARFLMPYMVVAFLILVGGAFAFGDSVLGAYATATVALLVAAVGCTRWVERDEPGESPRRR